MFPLLHFPITEFTTTFLLPHSSFYLFFPSSTLQHKNAWIYMMNKARSWVKISIPCNWTSLFLISFSFDFLIFLFLSIIFLVFPFFLFMLKYAPYVKLLFLTSSLLLDEIIPFKNKVIQDFHQNIIFLGYMSYRVETNIMWRN